ncbi:DUF4349 domain-containing protein [Oerskovia turbata]|uniref:DUF4349 domain-containing protein n=1 Tax=Oerskovia turbata TaxID=1713 RepID=A0A4Q1L4E3_9CELL|nr:DUF4349 domain-containing protein [Oerskovia turbata]RXR26241.1 DUF4349 domain-containing protein [Oerskovia turbata]RXR36743.1 DUF4349 domain-containing protein [Oerskovia turbata]
MRTSPRTPSIVAIALLGGLLLAGCSATDGGTEASGAADAFSQDSVAQDASDGGSGLVGASVPDEDREVITTGDLTVVAADPRAAVQAISELVEAAGGRVESRAEHAGEDDQAYGSLTVRVPADKVTATVDALDGIGEVQDVTLDAQDVTATAIDLDARIQALGTSVTRLQTLMSEATTTADLLAAEQELTARQAELESLQSQRSSLTDRVDMSTLTIQVLSQAPETTIRPAGFLGGLAAGWSALLVALNAVVVAAGALLPWLVSAALVLLVVRAVLRAVRAKRPGAPPLAGPDEGPPSDGGGDGDGGGGGSDENARLVGSRGHRG